MLDVATAAGIVRGTYLHGRGDRMGLRTWRGVPYATAVRFHAPEPFPAWPGVRHATRFGPAAPQDGRSDTSEDCLTLNVLAPADLDSAPRPVMVFVHGGAYVTGSSSDPLYHGESLVRDGDVIFVSINYRLGALGYLDFTEFGPFASNLGLRDQVAALEWVRENIAAFGGDPDNVTLFGQSSGANAVTTLLATPAAAGLFARAIAQSPPVASVYGRDRAHRWAAEFVTLLGARPADAAHALVQASPSQLVRAVRTLTMRHVDDEPGTRATAPVVDDDYLPMHPLDAFAGARAHPVPLIIGTNSHEGRYFPLFLDIIPTKPERIEKMFDQTDPAVKHRVLTAYAGYPGRRACADLGGDVVFWEPSLLCAQGHSRYAETYSYRYDFEPRLLRLSGLRATHGTELFSVFGQFRTPRGLSLLGDRDAIRAVADEVSTRWITFAHNGSPGPGWPRYSTDLRKTLVIDADSRIENDPNGHRRRAWIGYKHRR